MATILITGAKGLVGRSLSSMLKQQGHKVIHLTRKKTIPSDFEWDWQLGYIQEEALEGIDHIVHLAGENIGKRWTKRTKELIFNSRIRSLELLYKKLKDKGVFPRTLVCASAVGYYGTKYSEQEFTEENKAGEDFLANLCVEWENAANKFKNEGVRVVSLRTGIVISTQKGGFVSKMRSLAGIGLFVTLGNGHQHLPWIHLDDLCTIYSNALTNSMMEGPYNAVAPQIISQREMVQEIALANNKPYLIINIPTLMIKLAFGEMSQVILSNCKVSCKKLGSIGYQFIHSNFKSAIKS